MKYKCVNRNKCIHIDQLIGTGGEGNVHKIKENNQELAKIYHKSNLQTEDKLKKMVSNPPDDPTLKIKHISIAWPIDILENTNGSFSGYLMPAISDSFPFSTIYNPKARKSIFPNFNYQYLVRTAINICSAVSAIHNKGYIVGDMNESNILVQPTALVSLIDTDSFQIGKHRCHVGKPEYTPPELQGKKISTIDRKIQHDNFSLAVLIHLLLMNGLHPFFGVGKQQQLEERIKNCLCPYKPKGPKPPPSAIPLSTLTPELQQLFVKSFVDGHANPKVRPCADKWMKVLNESEKKLTVCSKNSEHFYFGHLNECIWCKRENTLMQHQRPLKAAKPKQTNMLSRKTPSFHNTHPKLNIPFQNQSRVRSSKNFYPLPVIISITILCLIFFCYKYINGRSETSMQPDFDYKPIEEFNQLFPSKKISNVHQKSENSPPENNPKKVTPSNNDFTKYNAIDDFCHLFPDKCIDGKLEKSFKKNKINQIIVKEITKETVVNKKDNQKTENDSSKHKTKNMPHSTEDFTNYNAIDDFCHLFPDKCIEGKIEKTNDIIQQQAIDKEKSRKTNLNVQAVKQVDQSVIPDNLNTKTDNFLNYDPLDDFCRLFPDKCKNDNKEKKHNR